MSAEVERIVSEVSMLPEIERVELVSRLLEQDEPLSPKWKTETKRRIAESRAGITERRPYSELKTHLAKKYGQSKED